MSVDYRPNRGLWRARISINRKRRELGLFASEREARLAYEQALLVYGPQRVRRDRRCSDPAVRFASKTEPHHSGCILWLGATDKDGYGKFQLNGGGRQKHVRAHRYAYFLKHGEWPNQLVLHSCDTPACVNPDHLSDGDQGKNVRDCVARGRHRHGNGQPIEARP